MTLLLTVATSQLAFGSPGLQTTNPATLVVAGKEPRWEAGVLTGHIVSDFHRSSPAGVAASGRYDSAATHPFLPFFALSYPYNDRLVLGFALDTPHYLDQRWKDHTFDVNLGGQALDLVTHGKLIARRIGPAAGARLGERWSTGGRIFVQHVEAMEDTDFARVAGEGTTYGAQVGVRYAGAGYIVGAAYTTRTNTEVQGSQTNVHPLVAGGLIAGDAKADILLPARLQSNVAVALRPDLWGELDLEWLGWSYVDERTVYQSDGTTANRGKNLRHYRDIVNTRLGIKWQVRPTTAVYSAIGYEPTPVPEQDVTPAQTFLRRTRLTVGATWDLRATWRLDTLYQYARGHARTITETDQDSLSGTDTSVFEGTYSSRTHALKITLGGVF